MFTIPFRPLPPIRPSLADWRCFRFSATLLAVALAVSSVHANVEDRESEPFPGIRLLERTMTDPPTRVFAAFVSLEETGLRFDATAPTTQPRTTAAWAEETGALVAINADFYRYVDGRPHLYGDAVGGGERWPKEQTGRNEAFANDWFFQRHGWIAFGDNWAGVNSTRFIKTNRDRFPTEFGWKPEEVTDTLPPGTRALVSGFPQLVIDGKAFPCESPTASDCFPDRGDMRARHPRTAVGLTEDRNTVILVVVDGRSRESVGMYGAELAALMEELGAHAAFNLDGGASSQMYVKGRGVINTPSATPHRRVLNHLGVFPSDGRR